MKDAGKFPWPGRALAVALVAVLAAPAWAHEDECALNAEEIYLSLEPSVVEVLAITVNPFLVSGRIAPSTGTGFVLEGGFVATNFHVVADARELVVFSGEAGYHAELVGIDPTLDLAVLRPEARLDGGAIPFAQPGSARIGHGVYALGFPLGIGKSISAGIISGEGRVLPNTTSSWLSPMIQTDAAISGGHSGGPLVDGCGRVVGMVAAHFRGPEAENLGLAIPVEVLAPALEEMIATGKVARPWHGLYGQMADAPILTMLGAPVEEWERSTGFLVETVEPGSAADRAGLVGGNWPVQWGGREFLLGGDVVTHVNGERIDTLQTALDAVRNLAIGQVVSITYLRDGVEAFAEVTIEERPLQEGELDVYRMRRARR